MDVPEALSRSLPTGQAMDATMTRARGAVGRRWKSLSSTQRRRIVLASFFAMALAARDVVLLAVASGFFALSEMQPARRPLPQAS